MTPAPAPLPGRPAALAPRAQPAAGRLTVVETLYYQPADHPAVQLAARFEVPARPPEPAYSRPGLRLGPDWVSVDLGWLAGKLGPAGAVVFVQNTDRTAGRDLELALRDDPPPGEVMLVGPGEAVRLRPADPAALRLRCRAGLASATVTVLPLG